MTTVTQNTSAPIGTTNIPPVLRGLRWRIRGYVVVDGIAHCIAWLGLMFWISLAADYLPVLLGANEMPRAARLCLLFATAVVLLVLFYWSILRRTLVSMTDRNMALLVERRYSDFQDSLLTTVEMQAQPDHALKFHPDMLDHVSQQARAGIGEVRLRQVFRFAPLARSVLLALLMIASITAWGFFAQESFGLAVHRMYLLSDQPWPRQTHIEISGFQNRRVKVARGSDFPIRVTADARRFAPEVCTIYYRTKDGQRGRVNMRKNGLPRGGHQLYIFDGKPFQGVLSTVEFDVRGYDHRLRDYAVDVVDAPAVTRALLDCTFPAYLVDKQLGIYLDRTVQFTPGLQLPCGTHVIIRASSNKDLLAVQWKNPATGETSEISIDKSSNDRREFSLEIPDLAQDTVLEVLLHDADGVKSDKPFRIAITALLDRPPRVDINLQGIGTAITPDARLPFSGQITDDNALSRAWSALSVDGAAPREFPFSLVPGDDQEGMLDLRHQQRRPTEPLQLEPGQKLEFAILSADKYDLEGGPNIGHSDTYTLDVVTLDQLLARLEGRELALRRRLEQIIEEITATRDSLLRVKNESSKHDATSDGQEPEDTPTVEGSQNDTSDQTRARALRLLRVQRAIQETQRSAREVYVVGVSFDDICAELINNRVDTEQRKVRLKQQIADPLKQIADELFPALVDTMRELESMLDDRQQSHQRAAVVVEQTDEILVRLEEVLQRMLDLETYNELIDIVRSIIKEQEKLHDDTNSAKRKQARDVLGD